MLGNEAADPDSCVCAIALAAALDARLPDAVVAPVIADDRPLMDLVQSGGDHDMTFEPFLKVVWA